MNADTPWQEDPLDEDHRARSNLVQRIVQHSGETPDITTRYTTKPPRRIAHFWNDVGQLPKDVSECIHSWNTLEKQGFEFLMFDENSAKVFIRNRLGMRYENAFEKCYHPAMQSDYFRLCYILMEGGCYVDVDDVYQGVEVEPLFSDGRLKIQPLCYDIAKEEMVSPSVFAKRDASALSWIFYFNNNPLIAGRGHPLIERALVYATSSLEEASQRPLPEIQSTTGPGNLTRSIFDAIADDSSLEQALVIVHNWEDIATTHWPLSYRDDMRNWRLSNQRIWPSGQSDKKG